MKLLILAFLTFGCALGTQPFKIPLTRHQGDDRIERTLHGDFSWAYENGGRNLVAGWVNITLNDTSDTYYTAPLKIGSDATVRKFLVDTGSDILWLPSGCGGTCYAGAGATTLSTAATVNYIDGTNFTGTWYKANVIIGSVTVTNMNLVLASSTNLASSRPYEGICGLSPKNITYS